MPAYLSELRRNERQWDTILGYARRAENRRKTMWSPAPSRNQPVPAPTSTTTTTTAAPATSAFVAPTTQPSSACGMVLRHLRTCPECARQALVHASAAASSHVLASTSPVLASSSSSSPVRSVGGASSTLQHAIPIIGIGAFALLFADAALRVGSRIAS